MPNHSRKGGMKRLGLPSGAIARARRLRRSATEVEQKLWKALRESLNDTKWRQQVPFGPYTADFASHGAKLIIELDGGQHAEAAESDLIRTRFLNAEGYRVLRFWNNEVMENLDGVLAVIANTLSPCGRGQGEGPAASAAEKTPAQDVETPHVNEENAHARRRRAPASSAGTPRPLPSPTRGEGGHDKSVDLESV